MSYGVWHQDIGVGYRVRSPWIQLVLNHPTDTGSDWNLGHLEVIWKPYLTLRVFGEGCDHDWLMDPQIARAQFAEEFLLIILC